MTVPIIGITDPTWIRDIENEMYAPDVIPEIFKHNGPWKPLDPDRGPMTRWYFPITPRQIIERFLHRVRRSLEHIYEHCEITDEPEGPWTVTQHVRHEEVEALEKLEWELVRLDASLNPPPPIKKEGEL